MEESILFYDLETFGAHPRHDRIAQFAALRCNLELEEIEAPVVLYCKPADDYLPNPEACLITGISPQECAQKGVSEYEFARRIFHEFTRAATTVVGYNSVRFDDELVRNLFYRNLFDPYLREYANGNSRWDIINLARACHDLRPAGINWPQRQHQQQKTTGTHSADTALNEDKRRSTGAGKAGTRGTAPQPSFKLEDLAAANNIQQDQAHDALSDVHATLGLARLIRQKHERLYNWYFALRRKEAVRGFFDLNSKPVLLYTAAELTRSEGCTSLICPITAPADNSGQDRNSVYCVDLRYDPELVSGKSADEIRRLAFLPRALEDSTDKRYPIYNIKINRIPFLAPASALDRERAQALGIDRERCQEHRHRLLKDPDLPAKIREVFSPVTSQASKPVAQDPHSPSDPDYSIYESFFAPEDKHAFGDIHAQLEQILQAPADSKPALVQKLIANTQNTRFVQHERVHKLLVRVLGRSFSPYLRGKLASNWRSFCQNRILFPLVPEAMDSKKFERRIHELLRSASLKDKLILKELEDYYRDLTSRMLAE